MALNRSVRIDYRENGWASMRDLGGNKRKIDLFVTFPLTCQKFKICKTLFFANCKDSGTSNKAINEFFKYSKESASSLFLDPRRVRFVCYKEEKRKKKRNMNHRYKTHRQMERHRSTWLFNLSFSGMADASIKPDKQVFKKLKKP